MIVEQKEPESPTKGPFCTDRMLKSLSYWENCGDRGHLQIDMRT